MSLNQPIFSGSPISETGLSVNAVVMLAGTVVATYGLTESGSQPGTYGYSGGYSGLSFPNAYAFICIRTDSGEMVGDGGILNFDSAGNLLYDVVGTTGVPALAISGGNVTVGTNADKTGYSLATVPPTAGQIAAAVLKTPGNLLATDSSGNVAANNLPTDYQQRNVAVTLPSPAPSGYGSTGGSGSGPIAINQNTGGRDNLRYVDSTGAGVEGASVLIYLATDWPGNPSNVQATVTTGPDGRWLTPGFVVSGTYVAVFVKIGADGPDVSSPFTV